MRFEKTNPISLFYLYYYCSNLNWELRVFDGLYNIISTQNIFFFPLFIIKNIIIFCLCQLKFNEFVFMPWQNNKRIQILFPSSIKLIPSAYQYVLNLTFILDEYKTIIPFIDWIFKIKLRTFLVAVAVRHEQDEENCQSSENRS